MTIREIIEGKDSVKEIDEYVKHFNYAEVGKDEAPFLLRFAQDKYGLLVHDGECLDAKADLLVKYLGLVPPALAALISYLGPGGHGYFSWWELGGLFGGLGAWIGAMGFALWAAKPGDMPYPPTMRNLLQDAPVDRPIEMVLALKYEQSIAALIELGNMKGKKLKCGYWLMAASIALLFFSLISGRI